MTTTKKEPVKFVPLREFWADYIRMQIHTFNLNHQFFSINDFLDKLLGNLTVTEITNIRSLPLQANCFECKNNTDKRLESVCQTHVGCLKGALEGILNIPLNVEYFPDPYKICTIRVNIANDNNGNRLCAKGKRKNEITLISDADLHFYSAKNNSTHQTEVLSKEVFSVLEQLTQFKSAKEISKLLDFTPEKSALLMDTCYRSGWIDCSFFPEIESLN